MQSDDVKAQRGGYVCYHATVDRVESQPGLRAWKCRACGEPFVEGSKLDEREKQLIEAQHQLITRNAELAAERSRLGEALKFVQYIAHRYEEGWDDPITERFYNEAKALLGSDVETHKHYWVPWALLDGTLGEGCRECGARRKKSE